jgi:hypothetical protein
MEWLRHCLQSRKLILDDAKAPLHTVDDRSPRPNRLKQDPTLRRKSVNAEWGVIPTAIVA